MDRSPPFCGVSGTVCIPDWLSDCSVLWRLQPSFEACHAIYLCECRQHSQVCSQIVISRFAHRSFPPLCGVSDTDCIPDWLSDCSAVWRLQPSFEACHAIYLCECHPHVALRMCSVATREKQIPLASETIISSIRPGVCDFLQLFLFVFHCLWQNGARTGEPVIQATEQDPFLLDCITCTIRYFPGQICMHSVW